MKTICPNTPFRLSWQVSLASCNYACLSIASNVNTLQPAIGWHWEDLDPSPQCVWLATFSIYLVRKVFLVFQPKIIVNTKEGLSELHVLPASLSLHPHSLAPQSKRLLSEDARAAVCFKKRPTAERAKTRLHGDDVLNRTIE
jgi:hypothetical protein